MGHMSDAELRAAFRQAVERAEQSPGEHCSLPHDPAQCSTECHSPDLQSPLAGPCQLTLLTCSSSEVNVLASLFEGGHHLARAALQARSKQPGAALLVSSSNTE